MVIRMPWLRFCLRAHRHCLYRRLLWATVLLCCGCTPLILTPTPAEPLAELADARLIVQVDYPTVELLNTLAGELDIWEVDRAAQTLVARITLEQYDTLRQQDLQVTLDCAKMRQYAQSLDLTFPTVAQLMEEQCPAN